MASILEHIEDDYMKDNIARFLKHAESYCNIKFAYIFGFYARKENSEDSDRDFAFIIDDGLSKIDEVFARDNLIELDKGIFIMDVDVIFLSS
jgi:predicted nucleotidyltransferase